MAESSSTIATKIQSLLDTVDTKNMLLTFGFVRESGATSNIDIPNDIINYCVIYTF